jgi:hyperosmotically inducible periplasmic protein
MSQWISRRFVAGVFALILSQAFAMARTADAGRQAPPPNTADYPAWLSNEVRHQLVMLPFYSLFDNLEYQVRGDQVILMGQVLRPSLKADAAAAVKHIEGVASVDNQIEVLPLLPMDDQIRRAEFRAIYGAPGFDIYRIRSVQPIHIIVRSGHVTLEGVVASEMDRNLAGMAANQVRNVFSVTNNLRVEHS